MAPRHVLHNTRGVPNTEKGERTYTITERVTHVKSLVISSLHLSLPLSHLRYLGVDTLGTVRGVDRGLSEDPRISQTTNYFSTYCIAITLI